jgi:nickel-dependent lactate racemase
MGGEGSMMHAIKSLKANRELLKRRKLKSKDDVYGKKSVTKLHFKKSSRWDVIRVRKQMFIQKEKEKRRTILAVFLTLLVIFLGYLLFK